VVRKARAKCEVESFVKKIVFSAQTVFGKVFSKKTFMFLVTSMNMTSI